MGVLEPAVREHDPAVIVAGDAADELALRNRAGGQRRRLVVAGVCSGRRRSFSARARRCEGDQNREGKPAGSGHRRASSCAAQCHVLDGVSKVAAQVSEVQHARVRWAQPSPRRASTDASRARNEHATIPFVTTSGTSARSWLSMMGLTITLGCSSTSPPPLDPLAEACGGERPDALTACTVGLFRADWGGSADAVLACHELGGECRWFEGGCVPIGYRPIECPADMPCCETTADGTWPYPDAWAPR